MIENVDANDDIRPLGLSVGEVAKRLGISLGTVRRWSDSGDIPSHRTPGGQRRYSSAEVDAFIHHLSGREPAE